MKLILVLGFVVGGFLNVGDDQFERGGRQRVQVGRRLLIVDFRFGRIQIKLPIYVSQFRFGSQIACEVVFTSFGCQVNCCRKIVVPAFGSDCLYVDEEWKMFEQKGNPKNIFNIQLN